MIDILRSFGLILRLSPFSFPKLVAPHNLEGDRGWMWMVPFGRDDGVLKCYFRNTVDNQADTDGTSQNLKLHHSRTATKKSNLKKKLLKSYGCVEFLRLKSLER
jgi:hypothetical protein